MKQDTQTDSMSKIIEEPTQKPKRKFKLKHRLVLTYGLMFLVAIASAVMLIVSVSLSQHYAKRANLAHESYEKHLLLSNATYQLLKEYDDSLLVNGEELSVSEQRKHQLRHDIEQYFKVIRSNIGNEISMVGTEEVEELHKLDRLHTLINDVARRYESIQRTAMAQHITSKTKHDHVHLNDLTQTQQQELIEILNGKYAQQINTAINHTLAEEKVEVAEATKLAETMLKRFKMLAIFSLLLSIIMLELGVRTIIRKIHNPLQKIIDGANHFMNAEWSHRIHVAVKDELADVANAFNHTAKVAGQREKSFIEDNAKLEVIITERTFELKEAVQDLEEQSLRRQHLLADVSHELRTPLTIISGEVDVTLRGKQKSIAEYTEALQRIREATKHTAELVNDVLFVARQEAGQSRLVLKRNNLALLMTECADIYTPKFTEHQVNLRVITAKQGSQISNQSLDDTSQFSNPSSQIEDDAFRWSCDKKRIRQVILILLDNSLNHAKGMTEVVIRLLETTEHFELSVADNGVGIRDIDKPNIFERFFRGSNASENYEAGTGLGLPVAKAIIEAHQGSITVTDSDAGGAKFFMILPKH